MTKTSNIGCVHPTTQPVRNPFYEPPIWASERERMSDQSQPGRRQIETPSRWRWDLRPWISLTAKQPNLGMRKPGEKPSRGLYATRSGVPDATSPAARRTPSGRERPGANRRVRGKSYGVRNLEGERAEREEGKELRSGDLYCVSPEFQRSKPGCSMGFTPQG